MTRILLRTLILVGIFTMAAKAPAAIAKKPAKRKALPAECYLRDNSVYKFEILTKLIRNERCGIKSIDDLLGRLPKSMRQQMSLFYRSQSLQGPHVTDYMNPRAILTSKQENAYGNRPVLILTFVGNPKSPTYPNLEVLEIDEQVPAPSLDIFKYYDLKFPTEAEAQKLSWIEAQSKIQISDPNPQKCANCHGNPARPIFPTYALWPGAYGSFHMKADPTEREQLKKFKDSAAGRARYRHLDFKKLSTFEANVLDSREDILRGSFNVDLNVTLAQSNAVRVARLIQKTPDYDRFKYAIAGTLLNCESSARAYFPKTTADLLEKALDSRLRLNERFDDEKMRKLLSPLSAAGSNQFGDPHDYDTSSPEAFRRFMDQELKNSLDNSLFLFRLWVDTASRQGPNRVSDEVARVRYVIESRGIDMSNWFLDLKQPTYRVMDGTGSGYLGRALIDEDPSLARFKVEKKQVGPELHAKPTDPWEIRVKILDQIQKLDNQYEKDFLRDQENRCEQLKEESLKAFSAKPDFQILPIVSYKETLVKGSYPPTFLNTCARCHTGETRSAPKIPFHDPLQFRTWLSQPDNLTELKYRLTAPEIDRMPPTRNLEPEELSEIDRYIQLVTP